MSLPRCWWHTLARLYTFLIVSEAVKAALPPPPFIISYFFEILAVKYLPHGSRRRPYKHMWKWLKHYLEIPHTPMYMFYEIQQQISIYDFHKPSCFFRQWWKNEFQIFFTYKPTLHRLCLLCYYINLDWKSYHCFLFSSSSTRVVPDSVNTTPQK